jgi:hypothetical protein
MMSMEIVRDSLSANPTDSVKNSSR